MLTMDYSLIPPHADIIRDLKLIKHPEGGTCARICRCYASSD
jgi:predicted cupin superfamily sugar epimerase